MKILVAGCTGFIGHHLVPALLADGHDVTGIGRSKDKINKAFSQQIAACSWDELDQLDANLFDAVINLSGKNIGDGRWTDAVKNEIISSRVITSSRLASWCASAESKPHLYNASAIGYYGLQKTDSTLPPPLNENSEPASNDVFIYEVGQAWENAVKSAVDHGVAVTIMRFGVVLKRNEGALKKMQPSFYFGMGGKIGNGQQAFTWIHINDLINAVIFLLENPKIVGPVNLVSPKCISQAAFASSLAKAMHRPALMITPSFILKAVFGQMADELLLNGQHVYPKVLLEHGFKYAYPEIDDALQHEWR